MANLYQQCMHNFKTCQSEGSEFTEYQAHVTKLRKVVKDASKFSNKQFVNYPMNIPDADRWMKMLKEMLINDGFPANQVTTDLGEEPYISVRFW